MAKQRILGRVIVLLLLILVLVGGGILWFDYLSIIDAKTVLAPFYKLIGRDGRTQAKPVATAPGEMLSLDAERLAIRLEALSLRDSELEKQEQVIASRHAELEQMAQELDARQKALEEQQRSFNSLVQESDTKGRNVEQNARYLNGMPPQNAVEILNNMDDQDIIDVFRKADEIAAADGVSSTVAYWMSLMPAERAADIQRKMAKQPVSLN
ncbi:flagellar protein FlbB [Spirochaetia bacterium]|nr:flagellar protein FlbB [Spirochaetia bacterium]GHU29357.1 flagellar protein FlbB [Spirochaetia bacterium]